MKALSVTRKLQIKPAVKYHYPPMRRAKMKKIDNISHIGKDEKQLGSKEFACNAGGTSSIPESRRAPGGGNVNPL